MSVELLQVSDEDQLQRCVDGFVTLSSSDAPTGRDSNVVYRPLYQLIKQSVNEGFTLDVSGLLAPFAANLSKLSTGQQSGLKREMEKASASCWTEFLELMADVSTEIRTQREKKKRKAQTEEVPDVDESVVPLVSTAVTNLDKDVTNKIVSNEDQLQRCVDGFVTLSSVDAPTGRDSNVVYRPLYQLIKQSVNEGFTLDVSGLLAPFAANLSKLSTGQQSGLKREMEKASASCWTEFLELMADVSTELPTRVEVLPEQEPLVDWIRHLRTEAPETLQLLNDLLALDKCEQEKLMESSRKRKRSEPNQDPNKRVKNILDTGKLAIACHTVLKASPQDLEARNKLFQYFMTIVKKVAAEDEDKRMDGKIISCISQSAKLLTAAQAKTLHKSIAENAITSQKLGKKAIAALYKAMQVPVLAHNNNRSSGLNSRVNSSLQQVQAGVYSAYRSTQSMPQMQVPMQQMQVPMQQMQSPMYSTMSGVSSLSPSDMSFGFMNSHNMMSSPSAAASAMHLSSPSQFGNASNDFTPQYFQY